MISMGEKSADKELGSNIDMVEVVSAIEDADIAPKKAVSKVKEGYTRIILEENDTIPPTGLFVGHNGKGYNLTPGVEIEIPEGVLGVLNDAVMAFPQTDPQTQQVIGYRQRMRYPYRNVNS